MSRFSVPVYGEQTCTFDLPETWRVTLAETAKAPALSPEAIRQAFASPIGSAPLRELARGSRSAAVIVEDISRPAPTHLLVPIVVEELLAGGVPDCNIKLVSALGAHRTQTGPEFRIKMGREMVERFEVLNQNIYENLTYLGQTEMGTPIWVNRFVAESDIKVGVGGMVPHPNAGFGGGAKIVLPGVCGMETIAHHHLKHICSFPGQPDNPFRQDLEEVARIVGLNFSVNAVVNDRREIAGLFVGDMVAAHRAGSRFARQLYTARVPRNADVVISNAYPLDIDLMQAQKAFWNGPADTAREGGALVLLGRLPEGVGYHLLEGKGGRGYQPPDQNSLWPGRRLIVCSENISYGEASQIFSSRVEVFPSMAAVVEALLPHYPDAFVNLFTVGCLALVAD